MDLFANEHPFLTGRDISSMAFWSKPFIERDETFAWLRRHAPVSWHPPIDESPAAFKDHNEAGFWAVTRAADISEVSRDHTRFSSSSELRGITVRPVDPSLVNAPNMLGLDPPEHNIYRNFISAAFTPKSVARLNAKIVERAEQIVTSVVGAGTFDFVEQVSSKLPMLTIADMVGVPESQVAAFTHAGNSLITTSDEAAIPEGKTIADVLLEAALVIRQIAVDLVRYRRDHPSDDIATALANAEVHGRPLNDDEVTSVLGLLSVAGNDTTRHTTTWTTINLWRNPDQKEWLMQDFQARISQAIDEFVRHATVVTCFGRTVTEDCELGGAQLQAGDKVILFYNSGNRDESLFPDPHRFDLARPRTNHVAFGGRGVHYCLGNVVAKAQLRAMFDQILTNLPNLEITGEPVLLYNEQFNAIRSLPVCSN